MGEDSGSGAPRSRKKDWALTHEAFEELLRWLDPDRDRAGDRFEQIRQKLIIFFILGNGLSPEDLIDETFNRVAGKITGDAAAREAKPESYCLGVARRVLLEDINRNRERKKTEIESLPPSLQPTVNPGKVREEEEQKEKAARERTLRDECARRCLAELKPEERELIIEYSSGGDKPGDKKRQRRKIAERLVISTKILTNRMALIRKWLIHCRAKCVSEKQPE